MNTKVFVLAAIVLFFATSICFGYEISSLVNYKKLNIHGIAVDVIYADLKDSRIVITPAVSKNFPHNPEPFESIVIRQDPLAAINGNFFSTDNFKPVGDIVIDGKLVYFGGRGTAMAITEDNNIKFIKVTQDRHMNWNGYKAVISCGPQLLEDGRIIVDAKSEGFGDPELFAKRERSAVGVTYDDYLVLVSINSGIYFSELACIMKEIGCKDAMNLDGGSSRGLYYKGAFINRPKTRMPNILLIDQKDYAPNALLLMREKLGETRLEVLSSVAMVLNKDQFLVKAVGDDQALLVLRFDNPRFFEAPQIGAKMDFSYNRLTIIFPGEKIKDWLLPN